MRRARPHARRPRPRLRLATVHSQGRGHRPRDGGGQVLWIAFSRPAYRGPAALRHGHDPHLLRPVKKQVGVGDVHLSDLARRYVNEVLDTNRLSYGPFSARFEAESARLHDCAYAVFCNSGTSALLVALAALKERHGWADGDEVLVPATTFIATSNIVIHNRMRPVFVDVTLADYGMDPEDVSRRITPRTRAIIPVH